jgi:8-amino-7-oxononanoate synthase
MTGSPAGLRQGLEALDSPQGPRVRVAERELVNFSGNDYLGLANHRALREAAHAAIDRFGAGAGASPLVSGHQRAHAQAEERFARFSGQPQALLFASGYAANLGVIAALCDRTAEVFADRLNHACLNDGAILSRAAFTRYRHLDLRDLEARLAASQAAVRLVASDTVFSMDGDIAPLPEMLALCERHGAWLLLDDAHGIGVLGTRGHGALEHFGLASPRIAYMATLGKALGGYGAFVAGAPELVDWLVQKARSYVYSTALPASSATVATAAMDLIDQEPRLVAALRERIAQWREGCRGARIAVMDSATAIQPVRVGGARHAMELSAALLEKGFLVPAIRPPTVPEGSSRLRVSLSAAHAPGDIEGLLQALSGVMRP